jgi:hypothetical protein
VAVGAVSYCVAAGPKLEEGMCINPSATSYTLLTQKQDNDVYTFWIPKDESVGPVRICFEQFQKLKLTCRRTTRRPSSACANLPKRASRPLGNEGTNTERSEIEITCIYFDNLPNCHTMIVPIMFPLIGSYVPWQIALQPHQRAMYSQCPRGFSWSLE